MSWEVVDWVYEESPFVGLTFSVHLAIAHVVNAPRGYEFYMSTDKLAKMCRRSRSSVTTALRELTEAGYLEVVKAGGVKRQTTRYRFLFTSALTALVTDATSALTDTTSAVTDSTSALSAREVKEQETEPISASALSGLVKSPPSPPPYKGDRDVLDSWLRNGVKRAV